MLNTQPFNSGTIPFRTGDDAKMATKKTAKKAPAKPAAAKKTPSSKTAEKKAPAKKASVRKSPAKKASDAAAPAEMPVIITSNGPLTGKIGRNRFFTAKQLQKQLYRLIELRERVTGEIISINRDSLNHTEPDPSLSDQGTDTFDREFALNQLSNEQDVLFEIDEAIRRIENGAYGICEMTEQPINIERLEALPYVRYSVQAQAELEKGRTTYRPFGATTIHSV